MSHHLTEGGLDASTHMAPAEDDPSSPGCCDMHDSMPNVCPCMCVFCVSGCGDPDCVMDSRAVKDNHSSWPVQAHPLAHLVSAQLLSSSASSHLAAYTHFLLLPHTGTHAHTHTQLRTHHHTIQKLMQSTSPCADVGAKKLPPQPKLWEFQR